MALKFKYRCSLKFFRSRGESENSDNFAAIQQLPVFKKNISHYDLKHVFNMTHDVVRSLVGVWDKLYASFRHLQTILKVIRLPLILEPIFINTFSKDFGRHIDTYGK